MDCAGAAQVFPHRRFNRATACEACDAICKPGFIGRRACSTHAGITQAVHRWYTSTQLAQMVDCREPNDLLG